MARDCASGGLSSNALLDVQNDTVKLPRCIVHTARGYRDNANRTLHPEGLREVWHRSAPLP